MNEPAQVNGRDALAAVLAASGVNIAHTSLHDVRCKAPGFFDQLRRGEPNVVVIHADNVSSLDVMALRWMFPAGVTPLVLCPSSPPEIAELAGIAVAAAKLIPGPVFVLLEDAVADSTDFVLSPETPGLKLLEPPPSNMLDDPNEERELRLLEARLQSGLKGLNPTVMDQCPADMGKPEWLLVSFGSASRPAAAATVTAREQGQRVNHLRIRQLWPLPEAELMRAVMGIKHIVVAERNLGQYAGEVRRFAPEITVVPAGGIGELSADVILQRLQRTPRCC